MIVGLGLVDADLFRRLSRGGFVRALVEELREPLESVLSEQGRRLWQKRTALRSTAPLLLDRPATEDELGRFFVAGALAARLREARGTYGSRDVGGPSGRASQMEGPLLLHLHGAWGSGKSSLLNFLKQELTHPSGRFDSPQRGIPNRWVVIEFNAWRHQRIAPPWWWLLTAVYHRGVQELRQEFGRWPAYRFRAIDYLWRLWSVRWVLLGLLLGLVATGMAVWAIAELGPNDLAGVIGVVGGLLAAGATVFGFIRGATRLLLVGSAGGASAFMRRTQDPMEVLKQRFHHLTKRIGHPLAVFVDDLDRCQADYVVEFLEGIQTLFGGEEVTYVIAADRRWLCDSFADVYSGYEGATGLPGRPLGFLFLEKTFQLSAAVPCLTFEERLEFLDVLVGRDGPAEAAFEPALKEATELFSSLATEQQIRDVLAETKPTSAIESKAVRLAALVQAHDPDVQEEREHLLSRFVHLLEPNPRAMKRLVNAYGFELDLQIWGSATSGSGQHAIEELALWTILNLRWSLLGEYLADHRDAVSDIEGGSIPNGLPQDLEDLFAEGEMEQVQAVVRGNGVDASLTPDAVRALVSLHRTNSRVEAAI